jgi:hypothetical protein
MEVKMAESEFQNELAALINRHSCENISETPDFILARYLEQCLKAFEAAVHRRDVWYGNGEVPYVEELSDG